MVEVENDFEESCHSVLRFSVRDEGIGIPPGIQARLFRPFTQADGSTTRKYGGTGLGLAISKALVQKMNGEIGAHSTLGAGSTFWFTAKFDKQENFVRTAQAPDRLLGLAVLIVDDNATNRKILEHYTREWGMRPECASSGAEALALVQARNGARNSARNGNGSSGVDAFAVGLL